MKKGRRALIKRLSVRKASGAPVLKTIGFVVSTPIRPNHLAAFEQALDANGWQTPTKRALVDPDSAGSKYGSARNELRNISESYY
jgi:hypothetical protein